MSWAAACVSIAFIVCVTVICLRVLAGVLPINEKDENDKNDKERE